MLTEKAGHTTPIYTKAVGSFSPEIEHLPFFRPEFTQLDGVQGDGLIKQLKILLLRRKLIPQA